MAADYSLMDPNTLNTIVRDSLLNDSRHLSHVTGGNIPNDTRYEIRAGLNDGRNIGVIIINEPGRDQFVHVMNLDALGIPVKESDQVIQAISDGYKKRIVIGEKLYDPTYARDVRNGEYSLEGFDNRTEKADGK